jgi:hypothetical protein
MIWYWGTIGKRSDLTGLRMTTGALESLVKLQAGIDAIGRSIEDERKLPDVTKRSTKGSEQAPKKRYAEEEDE